MLLERPTDVHFAASMYVGCFESELHPAIEEAIAWQPDQVVDIGAATGYYAVGLALRLPTAQVVAFESRAPTRERLRSAARLNGVEDRVAVRGRVEADDLRALPPAERRLVVCDIEGGEAGLLTAAVVPALANAWVVVEMHDVFLPGLSSSLPRLFRESHDVEVVANGERRADRIAAAARLSPGFRDLAVLERRRGPTPWGVFRPRP
jgi:predicted O-methyltransferase YrrM